MPRAKTKGELWRQLDFMYVLRDAASPATTFVDVAEAKGQTAISVDSEAGFTTGDRIRIGVEDQMEEHEVASTAVGEITVKTGLHRAAAVNTAVVERQQIDIGHLNDDGIVLTAPGDHNAVTIGTRTLAWAYLIGHTELVAAFSVVNWNLENIALVFGMDESATSILGAGTSADPYRVVLDPEDYAAQANQSFAFEGQRHDGDTIRGELWGAEVNVTALNATLARATQATPLAMEARATSGLAMFHWT